MREEKHRGKVYFIGRLGTETRSFTGKGFKETGEFTQNTEHVSGIFHAHLLSAFSEDVSSV